MAEIAFPLRIDNRGRTAVADAEAHIRDLIWQVLLTAPGERVNRPTFGSGLMQLAFAPLSDELAAAVQFQAQGALQQWLGNRIQVQAVDVSAVDTTLGISVRYILKGQSQQRLVQLSRSL
jgi:phage baseplate assembly protein W